MLLNSINLPDAFLNLSVAVDIAGLPSFSHVDSSISDTSALVSTLNCTSFLSISKFTSNFLPMQCSSPASQFSLHTESTIYGDDSDSISEPVAVGSICSASPISSDLNGCFA